MTEEKKNQVELEESNVLEETESLEQSKSKHFDILGLFREIMITVLVVLLVINFVAQPTTVDGKSMYPTLENSDQLIIEKVSKYFNGYERFDIIVFPYQYEENKFYIKRIIGLPGETIFIKNGVVYIDDEPLDDIKGLDLIEDYGNQEFPVEIPEDYYFVLGDNRNHSSDSRYQDVGLIPENEILGKGFLRVFPLNHFGILE
jgi:signal peptidase I